MQGLGLCRVLIGFPAYLDIWIKGNPQQLG
jgi:hypothetical protein